MGSNSGERQTKPKEKEKGEKFVLCFMGKLFAPEWLFLRGTVLCHMWGMNKAGIRAEHICQELSKP